MIRKIIDDAERAIQHFASCVATGVSTVTLPADLNVCNDLVQLAKLREYNVQQLPCVHLQVLCTNVTDVGFFTQHGV